MHGHVYVLMSAACMHMFKKVYVDAFTHMRIHAHMHAHIITHSRMHVHARGADRDVAR